MAEFKGVRPRWISVDEATETYARSETQRAVRRQVGDDWDITSAGVLLQPIPLGTTVEAHDLRRDELVIGEVVERNVRPDNAGSQITIYNIRTEHGGLGASRDHISIFDKSPEGIERWLDDGDSRPRTAEEIERWLGEDA